MRFLLVAILALGYVGLRYSRDFSPSAFQMTMALAVAGGVFYFVKDRGQDNDRGHNPVTVGFLLALPVFFAWTFPVGKLSTALFGLSAEQKGTVVDYSEHRRRRNDCRHENHVRLSDGKSISICGFELPHGKTVRVRMMSSIFGRYPEQRAGQVDLEGVGSVEGILPRSDKAAAEAEQARKTADPAL